MSIDKALTIIVPKNVKISSCSNFAKSLNHFFAVLHDYFIIYNKCASQFVHIFSAEYVTKGSEKLSAALREDSSFGKIP